MPTGYTDDIADGKVTDVREYAKIAARAFVYDCDELPREIPIDTYYAIKFNQTAKDLAAWDQMTLDKRYQFASEKIEEKETAERKYRDKQREIVQRYYGIQAQLPISYGNDSLPANLLEFMSSQLEDSIKYDGPEPRPFTYTRQTELEFIEKYRVGLEKDLAYYEKKYLKQIEDNKKSNEWLARVWKFIDEA